MNPRVVSESATEPIDIDEAAENLKAPDDGAGSYFEESIISRLITTARQLCEQELEMSLIAKTLELTLDSFCPTGIIATARSYRTPPSNGPCIELPNGPVRSILLVNYTDSDGNEATLADDQYRLSTSSSMAVLRPAYGVSWPSTRCEADAVRVQYAAGYSAADSPPQAVPEPIRQAMHLCISHFYINREAVDLNTLMELPLGVRALLAPYRQGLGV
jgi:uncharacterized phiE125 gp8 family phage protein